MKRLVLVVAVLVAAALYLYSERTARDAEPELPAAPQTDADPGRSDPRDPVSGREQDTAARPDDPDSPPSVPALADSDEAVREALEALFGADALSGWLLPEAIIERTVTTVNSLDGQPLPLRFRPLRHVPGLPVVITDPGSGFAVLSPENSARYTPLVRLLEAAEPADVAALYRDYYPLFQEAHRSLGVGDDDEFNDRLIEVIDHLLDTPEITSSIELVRPEVFYEFADPRLEGLSFGRKILIRAGTEHARRVKSWLRQFREEVAEPGAEESIEPIELPGDIEF